MKKKIAICFLLMVLTLICVLPTIAVASNTSNTIQETLNINLDDLNAQQEPRDPRGTIVTIIVLVTIAIIAVLVSWWYRTNF